MSSELTIKYTLDYKVSIDVDIAKESLPNLWEEADDEEQFLEFLTDSIISFLEVYEGMKRQGKKLPRWLTHFSLEERLDNGT